MAARNLTARVLAVVLLNKAVVLFMSFLGLGVFSREESQKIAK